jgi:DnaJ domain
LSDGQRLIGKLLLPPGRTLPEVLNGQAAFIEFQPSDGPRMFIAKSALHNVTPATVPPPAPDLWAGPSQGPGFDPFAVLGIDADATHELARQAYHKLAMVYHPDRYATADLPREVKDYMSVMARRVNAAYDAVRSRQKQAAARQEAVFTKPTAGQG